MDKRHKLYINVLSLISFAIIFLNMVFHRGDINVRELLFWGVFAVVSETFPIILPSGAATSVGMAVYIAVLINSNPITTILVSVIGFVFRVPLVDGKRKSIFSFDRNITLYNISSHVISLQIIGLLFAYLTKANTDYSWIIFVSLFLISVSELISILLVSVYIYTRDPNNRVPFFRAYFGSLPSTWSVGTLGLILAFVSGVYDESVVILVFIPLLLARYSFKLYFDSQKSSQETIEALNEALFVRDAYTAGHTTRVEEYAVLLAKATNYTAKDLETLKSAAKLHDIGKIGVPDGILNKPGKLTQEEYFQIRDHAAMGHKILSNVDSLKKVAEVVRHHHERPDGKGYPDGLKDNEIPRDSAILAIADTFDAMTSDRPYRKALSKEQALAELEKYKGTQFNQFLAEVFISIMKEYDPSKPQEVVAITEVSKHEHVGEKKVASTTLSKAVARHKKETVRLAEEVAE